MNMNGVIPSWMVGMTYSLSQRCKPDEKVSFIYGVPVIRKKTKWDFFMEKIERVVKNA